MSPDKQSIETLTEIITREVLSAVLEQEKTSATPTGQNCKVECVDNLCVKTCFDEAGQVISAGAERLSSTLGAVPTDANVAKYIDHTLLKAEATREQVTQLCFEARKFNFATVCVNATHTRLCVNLLRGSGVGVAVVVGFPLGATTPEVKAFEAEQALQEGASEIDMVINIGAIKDRSLDIAARDVRAVVNAVHSNGGILKVIIETALLTDEEKQIACLISKEAGADFVKTSTGFSTAGATVEDVVLMRRTVGPTIGVKAAGGVRSDEDLQKMVKAGATRIGTSAGVKIVHGGPAEKPAAAQPGAKVY
jgi:deoxyribose-phosphate aldolase